MISKSPTIALRAAAPLSEIAPEPRKPLNEFEPLEDEPDDDAQRLRAMQRQARIARQVALDPADQMGL